MEPVVDLLVFTLGAGLISAAVLYWRRRLPRLPLAVHFVLVAGFFSPALLTDRHQIATDIAFIFLPYSDRLSETVVPENPLLVDTVFQILPYRTLVRERLLRGEVPFWSHELGTGQPLLGNGQSAAFSPLHLLALPLPPLRSLTVTAALTLFLALVLMHALMVELGASVAGCMLSAVAFGFSTFSIVNVYYLIGPTVAWLPGVLLALLLIRRGARRGVLGLAVCAGGAGLSGHPSSLANVILVSAAVALFLAAKPPSVPRGRFLARCLGGALLAAGLAAVALVPFAEALPESHRYDVASGPFRQPQRFEIERLQAAASPLVFGHPKDRSWSGPRNYPSSATSYAGALTLALALAGLAADRRIRWILGGGGVALLLALWRGGPRVLLPMVLRDADRLQSVWVLAVSVGAGLALTSICGRGGAGKSRQAGAVAAGVALVVALLRPPGEGWQQLCWLVALATVLALVGGLYLERLRPALLGPVAVSLVAGELFLLLATYHPALPRSLRLGTPEAVAVMQEMSARHPGSRVMGEGHALRPGLAAIHGLWDPRGNDPMRPLRPFHVLRRFATGRQGFSDVRLTVTKETQPLLEYLGVRYVLARHGHPLPAPWRLTADVEGGQVWENRRALPIFFAPRRTKPSRGLRSVVANRDFSEVAFLSDGDVPESTGAVRLTEIAPVSNGFRLRAEAEEAALIVSSVSYSRLFRVSVGGAWVPTLPVNAAFLGFRIEPGRHAIRIAYAPRFWLVAVLAFTMASMALLTLVLYDCRAQRGRGRSLVHPSQI